MMICIALRGGERPLVDQHLDLGGDTLVDDAQVLDHLLQVCPGDIVTGELDTGANVLRRQAQSVHIAFGLATGQTELGHLLD
jgi:hypothetical protein